MPDAVICSKSGNRQGVFQEGIRTAPEVCSSALAREPCTVKLQHGPLLYGFNREMLPSRLVGVKAALRCYTVACSFPALLPLLLKQGAPVHPVGTGMAVVLAARAAAPAKGCSARGLVPASAVCDGLKVTSAFLIFTRMSINREHRIIIIRLMRNSVIKQPWKKLLI